MEAAGFKALAYEFVVGIVDQRFSIVEEREFLQALFLQRGKILLMCLPDVGHHSDRGLYDGPQALHLAGLRYAGLEHSHLGAFVEEPYRKGDPHLGVVTAWGTGDEMRWRCQLINPFLYSCLAVASGDANDGHLVLFAMPFGQPLEGFQRRHHFQEVCTGIACGQLCLRLHTVHGSDGMLQAFAGIGTGGPGHGTHHKVAYTAAVEVIDVAVSVARSGTDGKEERGLGEGQGTAVGKEPFDFHIEVAITMGADKRCHLFDGI